MDNHESISAGRVSVIGLGRMGLAVAERLSATAHQVSVWNRSPVEAAILHSRQMIRCETARDAVLASPVSIIILSDAAVALQVMSEARGSLKGKTIVNFSTGSPDDVWALRLLVEGAGARFLQGAILSYPRNIGHPKTSIVFQGDELLFAEHRDLLCSLGGNSLCLSAEAARIFALTFVVQSYVSLGGFYEAVALANGLGMGRSYPAGKVAETARFFVDDAIQDALSRMAHDDFNSDQATIETHLAAFEAAKVWLRAAGVSRPIFDAFLDKLRRAVAEGQGHQDIAALTKL